MTITATVQKGGIMLPPGTPWPDGTRVSVRPIAKRNGAVRKKGVVSNGDPLMTLLGKISKPRLHLPKDFALNHGHYVNGEPKK